MDNGNCIIVLLCLNVIAIVRGSLMEHFFPFFRVPPVLPVHQVLLVHVVLVYV